MGVGGGGGRGQMWSNSASVPFFLVWSGSRGFFSVFWGRYRGTCDIKNTTTDGVDCLQNVGRKGNRRR